MKFLVDAQLPPALATWLNEAGHEAVHVETLGLRAADDSLIWARALQTGAIIVTKDEDFAARSAQATTAPTIILAAGRQHHQPRVAIVVRSAAPRHHPAGRAASSADRGDLSAMRLLVIACRTGIQA